MPLNAPEVDNDRRALNIFHGIRRGKKEGRWLGARLRGYKNTRDENNKPIMVPEGGEQEELVRRAFKVLVPRYKDEVEHWVDGIHPAIVDPETFYAVQDILDGRKKKVPNKFQTVRDEFPLRGFLICPDCGRTLTASASRGKMKTLFHYYHCNKGCKVRFKASVINTQFEQLLGQITTNEQTVDLFGVLLKNRLKSRNISVRYDLEKMQKDIDKQTQRLKTPRQWF